MPAPADITFSVAALVEAHTALRDRLDAATSNAALHLLAEDDTPLAVVPLGDPCGTVDGSTGQLTFDVPANVNGDTGGTCTYGEFRDGDGTVVISVPVATGSTPESGRIVLNTNTIVAGEPIEVVSATLG